MTKSLGMQQSAKRLQHIIRSHIKRTEIERSKNAQEEHKKKIKFAHFFYCSVRSHDFGEKTYKGLYKKALR